jgi:Ca-activated chloride channel family protein
VISRAALRALFNSNVTMWRGMRIADLHFWHRSEARLLLSAIVALSVVLLIARSAMGRRPGRHMVVVPAMFRSVAGTSAKWLVHVPVLLFLFALPFFALAVADPYTEFVTREVTYPGRRITIAIDASASMETPFKMETLKSASPDDEAFFSSVAAAERFVRLRISSKFRDLVALIEFGNQAYVITPFTNDYDNILLSISLIGDPIEFKKFPDPTTLIGHAIEESVALFKAFNFLDASGNLLVIFSDGEDTNAVVNGRSLDDIVKGAVDAKVPVYFIRTNYALHRGEHIPDDLWIPAVEKTGGKFFAASDEKSLLAAINEIDRVSAGTIQLKEYSNQQPRFMVFASIAALCLTGAITSKLTVPYFRKFP